MVAVSNQDRFIEATSGAGAGATVGMAAAAAAAANTAGIIASASVLFPVVGAVVGFFAVPALIQEIGKRLTPKSNAEVEQPAREEEVID